MRLLAIILLCCTLAACGFHLRGNQGLPADRQTIWLYSDNTHDPLYKELLLLLERHGVEVVNSQREDAVFLQVGDGQLNRRLLSLFSTGQVAEYELIYRVNWRVQLPEDTYPQEMHFELLREYQDDPDQVLAKSRELALILSEMRRQAAQRILQQLSQQDVTQN